MSFSDADYCELLGLYLGDGHISEHARAMRLRLALDSKHRRIVSESEALLKRCFPMNSVGRQLQHDGNMTILWVYSRHLACLFPQHGAGLKHTRPIRLEGWQQELIAREPWPLLRGLIRSDGCSFINRTGRYEYLSFEFCNRSKGIMDIFLDACARVDVTTRLIFIENRQLWRARIYQRASVGRLVEGVGIKD